MLNTAQAARGAQIHAREPARPTAPGLRFNEHFDCYSSAVLVPGSVVPLAARDLLHGRLSAQRAVESPGFGPRVPFARARIHIGRRHLGRVTTLLMGVMPLPPVNARAFF